MVWRTGCLSLLGVSGSLGRDHNKKPYRVVCYLGSWANYRHGHGKFLIEDIDPFKCTHVIYGFAKLENNKITPFDPWLDLEDNWGLGAYKRFNSLRKQNPQLTTLIAIGGWNEGSAKYSQMSSTAATRKIFVNSVVEFLKKYDFDGLDFDWEYPGSREGSTPADKDNFLQVVTELRDAFEKDGFLLTSAVSAGRETIDLAYAIPKITALMDFINIMTYDFHGAWETFTGLNAPLYARPDESEAQSHLNVDYGVNYWLKNGATPKKLVMGMPLYGRCFTLRDTSVNGLGAPISGKGKEGPYTRDGGFLGYNEICEMFKQQHWDKVVDPHHLAPYAVRGNQWCGYDDIESIVLKTDYLKKIGLSGGMVWSVETDDFKGNCFNKKKYPLLSAINDRLENKPVAIPPHPNPTDPKPPNPDDEDHVPQPPEGKCKAEGSFAYEKECNSYYQCIQRPSGYEKIERRCPPGTAFHPEEKKCLFPSQVPGCGDDPTMYDVSTPDDRTIRPISTRPYPISSKLPATASRGPPTTPKYSTSPTSGPSQIVCKGEGIFPHPQECKKFFKCGPGTNGFRPAVFECPGELYYNPKISNCDYSENVDCRDRSTNN